MKRKVAGLPPVTKEWFEARRQQLSAASAGPLQKVWFDPLSRKKFYSENTYQAYVRSKKYQEMVRKSGNPAPSPVVTIRRAEPSAEQDQQKSERSKPTEYTVKPAVRRMEVDDESTAPILGEEDTDGKMDVANSGSEWETASEEDSDMESWEEWDVRCSLFDNHLSSSMEENLEYMWRKFGFYLPDGEFLTDPEGLLKYLGAKLQHGHIPLYESGENPNAKQFASLHGVQRHMIDSGKCKVFYDGNEDEYADFYDYSTAETMEAETVDKGSSGTMILSGPSVLETVVGSGYELAVPTTSNGVKFLGTREFARYYRQRHKAVDSRDSAAAARVIARYKKLSVPLIGDGTEDFSEKKKVQRRVHRVQQQRLAISIRRNINDNLPKNVPY